MKNRNCPNIDACWDYDASNCEGCAIGQKIEKFARKIKRLQAENAEIRHRAEIAERALRRKCESEADSTCPYDEKSEKCKECSGKRLCSTEYATQCFYKKALQQAEKEIREERK